MILQTFFTHIKPVVCIGANLHLHVFNNNKMGVVIYTG